MTTILDTQKKSKKDKNALIVGTELVQILTEINRFVLSQHLLTSVNRSEP